MAPGSYDTATDGLCDDAGLLPRCRPVLVSHVLSVERIAPSRDISGREYTQTSRPALLIAENADRYLESGRCQPFRVGQRAQAGNHDVGAIRRSPAINTRCPQPELSIRSTERPHNSSTPAWTH
jgi:hypothetical protein